MRRRLLILGGTAEAGELARAIAARCGDGVSVITSLAGRLAGRPDLPGELRVGGFGGADGLATFLREASITHVIDATHPFATAISRHAEAACAQAGLPRLVLQRPEWQAERGDRWYEVEDVARAVAILPGLGRRAFLTVGPGGLAAFRDAPGLWLLVRLFEAPATPLPLAEVAVVVARPPFTVAGEVALLGHYAIDVLVTKNSGGATAAKLAAARALGLPVVMIRRPPPPAGPRVETIDAALAWLRAGV